jgi:probable rRNA maturation factor
MIIVESDADPEWDSRIAWPALARKAAGSAIAASRCRALTASPLAVEISVKFATDTEVQALNAAYRNRNQPTNVLSFPMVDAKLLESLTEADAGEVLLGDVVLAHGVCAAEAADKDVAVETHAAHLIVHGVLHLLGYDHETGDADAEAMEQVEREALAAIGISDPYAVTEAYS